MSATTPTPTRIEFVVAGTPAPRPRPRSRAVRTRKGKYIATTYQPKGDINSKDSGSRAWARSNAWHDAVKWAIRPHVPPQPWEGPIRCTVDIFFERTQEMLKKHHPDGPIRYIKTPDRDNLDKGILDALTEAKVWKDDCQVCDGPVRKWWAARGCKAGVIVVIERIPETEDSLC